MQCNLAMLWTRILTLSKLSLLIVIFLAFYGHRSHQNVLLLEMLIAQKGKIF